jgi:hypothetical protein
MTILGLKYQIVNRVKETSNFGILEELYRLLAIESDFVFMLSDAQL